MHNLGLPVSISAAKVFDEITRTMEVVMFGNYRSRVCCGKEGFVCGKCEP